MQAALSQLGYNTGQADGVIGPLTRKRIRAFERDHKMDVTGRISGRLIMKIIKAQGKPLLLAKL
jgi:peptidoglycan hydrolase-like protein with peptidoglycan-binding domain